MSCQRNHIPTNHFQRRAVNIILPHLSYDEELSEHNENLLLFGTEGNAFIVDFTVRTLRTEPFNTLNT